jgi:hypothetical protein
MRTMLAALALALAAAALPAFAADVYTPPDWLKRPTPEMLSTVWPKAAWAKAEGGSATIACKISTVGTLFDCTVVTEEPAGEGFGPAAIALTPQLLFTPAKRNGEPVVSEARIPFQFKWRGFGTEPPSTAGARALIPAAMAWEQAPTYAEVAAAYPAKAKVARLGGYVALECGFTAAGVPQRCHAMREEPKGYGFADAAKALSKRFKAFPTPPGSKPISSGVVQLPIAFTPDMLDGAAPVVGKPVWSHIPDAEAMRATFPKAAPGVTTVRVMLNCVVQQRGMVGECRVEREEPAGQGFGQAALALAPYFRVATWSSEGLPVVGGGVNIPLRYEIKPAPPAPAAQ